MKQMLLEWFRNWRIDRRIRRLARQYTKEKLPYPHLQAFMETRVKPFMDKTEKKQ